jgi:hypothetical protein
MWRPYFKAESFLRKERASISHAETVFLNRIILAKRRARISLVVTVFLNRTILAKYRVRISHVENLFLNRTILAKLESLSHIYTVFLKQIHSRKMQSPYFSCRDRILKQNHGEHQ